MNFSVYKERFLSPWIALILIVIMGTTIYCNTYHAPFVFDDERITELGSHSQLDQIFKRKCIITYLTFSVNHKLCGLNVVGYHIVNVLIHILNGFLVYLLSFTIFKKLNNLSSSLNSTTWLMSLFTALIFVAHPIQTQAVTYTVQRTASMAAMFYMASVFFYLRARFTVQSSKPKAQSLYYLTFYLLSGFCGVLAFLSKSNTASLPGAILLVEYLLISRTWRNWKLMMPWFAVFFMLWIVFVLYVSGLFSGELREGNLFEDISGLSKETANVSRWQYLCTQFNVLVIYIRLLFLPINQNLDYMYPFKNGFFDGYTPLAFMFLTGIAAAGIMSIRKRHIISLAVFWFFITLSVESSIIPIRDAMFEHRLYLPMFGFAVFVSWALFHLFQNKRSWVVAIHIIIVISLGIATYYRNDVWREEIKLWSDVVSKSPKNFRAYYNLGTFLTKLDKHDEAVYNFKEAIRNKPDHWEAYNNMGFILYSQGKFDEAIFHYKELLRINSANVDVRKNMGFILLKVGKADEAILHYKEALRINPNDADVNNNLGIALVKAGRVDEAISHFKEALRIKPNGAEMQNNLENALKLRRN